MKKKLQIEEEGDILLSGVFVAAEIEETAKRCGRVRRVSLAVFNQLLARRNQFETSPSKVYTRSE